MESELRKKIQDLIQHEDFTKEELENLQKLENVAKTQLITEKSRRQAEFEKSIFFISYFLENSNFFFEKYIFRKI